MNGYLRDKTEMNLRREGHPLFLQAAKTETEDTLLSQAWEVGTEGNQELRLYRNRTGEGFLGNIFL